MHNVGYRALGHRKLCPRIETLGKRNPIISSPEKVQSWKAPFEARQRRTLTKYSRDRKSPMASMRRNHLVAALHLVEKQGGVKSLDMALQVQPELATSVLESFVAGCAKNSKPLPRSRRQYFNPLETSASKLEPSDAVALETRSLVISSSPVLRPGFSLIYGKKIQLFCRPRQPALMVRWVRSTRHAGILSNRAELINLSPTASRRIGCAASQRQVINCALAGNAC